MMTIQLSFNTTGNAITAGQYIRGTLDIVISRAIKTYKLEASFRGVESAKILTKHPIRTYREEQHLIHVDIAADNINYVIQQSNNRLPRGSHQVPFSIRLPSNLPASLDYGDCNDRLKVEYFLQAELIGSGILFDCETRHTVQIRAKPKPSKTIPYKVAPQCHTISKALFFKQGEVEFTAQADDTLLMPRQQLKLDLVIGHDADRTPIEVIRVVLREKAEWTVKGNHGNTHTTSRITRLIDEAMCPMLARKELTNDDNSTNMTLFMDESTRTMFLADDSQVTRAARNKQLLSMTLPPVPVTASNSHVSPFWKITHELTVTLVTKKMCNNPKFQIPIRVARCGQPTFRRVTSVATAA